MSVYEGIMQGLNEALDHAEGKLPLRTNRVSTKAMEPLEVFMPQEIKEIRIDLGLTQHSFADFMGVSRKTVEAWEAGRNKPEGPARRILAMVRQDPKLPERYGIVAKG